MPDEQVDTQEARTLAAIYAKGGDVIVSDHLRKMAEEVDRLRDDRRRWRGLAQRCIPAVSIVAQDCTREGLAHNWHEILEEWNSSLEE